MCWSNSLPSPCTTIPRAFAAAEGRPSSGPLAPTVQAAEEPAELQPTQLHPEIRFKAQLLPLAACYGGRRMAKQPSGSPIRGILQFTIKRLWENVTHPIWSPQRSFFFFFFFPTRELAQPNFPSHSEWERHIKLELCDNSEWQLSLVLITLFLLFRAIPAMLPGPGEPKIDKFKWIWKRLIYFPNVNILEESFISVIAFPSSLGEVPPLSIIRHLCPWWLMILMSMCSHSLCHTLFYPLA